MCGPRKVWDQNPELVITRTACYTDLASFRKALKVAAYSTTFRVLGM